MARYDVYDDYDPTLPVFDDHGSFDHNINVIVIPDDIRCTNDDCTRDHVHVFTDDQLADHDRAIAADHRADTPAASDGADAEHYHECYDDDDGDARIDGDYFTPCTANDRCAGRHHITITDHGTGRPVHRDGRDPTVAKPSTVRTDVGDWRAYDTWTGTFTWRGPDTDD